MKNFLEFVDRKQRETQNHLELVKKILEKGNFEIVSKLKDKDPYLFVKKGKNKVSFGGIRVFEIGGEVVYRVQREADTEPYGKAYPLHIQKMFNDFMSEGMEEKEAGQKVIDSVIHEIKKFYKESAKAESEIETGDKDGLGLIIKTGGTDYSSTVVNKM